MRPFYQPNKASVSVLEPGVDRRELWNMGLAFLFFEGLFFGPVTWGCFWASRYWRRQLAQAPGQ